MDKFIFDVDGTLTPSRSKMDNEFKSWFLGFAKTNDVYLVTGSDRAKTIEQVGESVYHRCKRVYNCSGNDVWAGANNVQTNKWKLPEFAEYFLNGCLYESKFKLRTGTHIEKRPGMVNFSVIGRGANAEQRQEYVAYDTSTNERITIANAFNIMFPDLQATVGGETGIDIAPKGADKSQIVKDFDPKDHIIFFGDAIFEGGNDWTLALELTNRNVNYNCHKVNSWQETWKILKNLVDKIN
jgi:phosphomannomutase